MVTAHIICTVKSAALGPQHERNGAIVIAAWHGVRHEKRRAGSPIG